MAFKIINLTPLSQGKNGLVPCSFTYWNEDDDTLTTAGFFPKSTGLRNGDQLTIIANDYSTLETGYLAESDNVLTFKKSMFV